MMLHEERSTSKRKEKSESRKGEGKGLNLHHFLNTRVQGSAVIAFVCKANNKVKIIKGQLTTGKY